MARNFSFLLSQVRTATKALIGGKAYFYEAGTSTLKTIWLDPEQNTEAANPYTLDANGTARLYGSGAYRVVIKDAALVTKFDWDDILPGDNAGYDVTGFGAIGDGVADDTVAILAALYEVVENGGVLYFPPGTYNISGSITLTGFTGTKKAFWIQGAGINATVLNRLDGCGTVFNFRQAPSGVKISDLTINANASTAPTTANHTIVVGEASNVTVRDIVINDPRASGVMILSDVAQGGGVIKDCLIDNVHVYGVTSGSNIGVDVGLFYAGLNVTYSGITNCKVYNVGMDLALSPGIGLELKYTGEGCYIDNGYVYNALQGISCPDDGAGAEVENARITNCFVKKCKTAVSGHLNNSIVENIIIDMDNDANLLEPLQIGGSGSSFSGITVKNLANPAKFHARFIAPASNNFVEITQIENSNSAKAIASFESTCVGNMVEVKRMALPSITSLDTVNIILDNNTDKTLNIVKIDGLPYVYTKTIASGAISVNRMTQTITLETEGAAATDDLDTITGGVDCQVVTFRTTADARDVVVKHGTGNIMLVGGADFTLDNSRDSISLQWHDNVSKWCETANASVA